MKSSGRFSTRCRFRDSSMTITELLKTVRRVEMRTRRLATDTMVGAYLSQFKGRGLDFEELRDYVPGDDVRDIDWNVTRRMGRPFVRRHREERDLTVVLAIDISASSEFGSCRRNKREFAAEVAATLAFSAARNSDKIALLLFTDRLELFLPPRKGRRHLLDPRERELPGAGLVTVEDVETGELMEVDTARAPVRETFRRENINRIAALDQALRRASVHTLRLVAGEPFAPTLQIFFETR